MSPRVKGGGEQSHSEEAPPTDRTSQTQGAGPVSTAGPTLGPGKKGKTGAARQPTEDLPPPPGPLHLCVTPGEGPAPTGHHLGVMRKRAWP